MLLDDPVLDHDTSDFLCYYINFQMPFQRNLMIAADTLDLDLDLIIRPDFETEWKDEEDYQKALITTGASSRMDSRDRECKTRNP
jgi:protein associated with RNAse G/E